MFTARLPATHEYNGFFYSLFLFFFFFFFSSLRPLLCSPSLLVSNTYPPHLGLTIMFQLPFRVRSRTSRTLSC
ncbi:hypothetical protein QBC45DRAFT_146657 [Copromyces sp. CBS 386.78]|nr:hypothetical protein QBC45DRAFT_146657 [Copromyces sp. CBS 386.78]